MLSTLSGPQPPTPACRWSRRHSFHLRVTIRTGAEALSRRCEGLPLLHDIRNENSGLGVARLTTRVWRFGGYLEAITCFERNGLPTLYRKLEAAFQDIGGFDSRMLVSRNRHSRLYGRFHQHRHIARHRTIRLRQNLSREAGRRCWRCTLGRRFIGNELRRNCADRA